MHLKASSTTGGLLGTLGSNLRLSILSKKVNSACEGALSGRALLANHEKQKVV